MKYSALFLCPFLLTFAVSGEESLAQPKEKAPEHFYFKESFQEDFHNLFEMIAIEYPDLLKELNPKDVDRALAAILNAIGSGIELSREKTPAAQKTLPGKTDFFQRKRIPGKLIYLRVDNLDPKAADELAKAFKEDSKGVILDLRTCSAGDYKIIESKLTPFLKQSLPHLAILTSDKTEGAAEILAELLFRHHKGIRIGEATAGAPYPRKTVTVSSRKWMIPIPPKGAEMIRYAKSEPQISVKAFPRLASDKFENLNSMETEDRALSRAADLLISLDLLDKKGLKK